MDGPFKIIHLAQCGIAMITLLLYVSVSMFYLKAANVPLDREAHNMPA